MTGRGSSAVVSNTAKPDIRSAFIAAGRELILEAEGSCLPSVVAVCERAGHSRSVFYGHYLDRDQYILALLDSVLADLTEALICDAIQGTFDLRERVRHFASVVGTRAEGDISELRMAYLAVLQSLDDHERVRKHHAEAVGRVIDLVAAAVRCGQDAGQFRSDLDPHGVAEFVMLVGITGVLWMDSGIALDAEGLGEGLVRLLEPSNSG